MYITICLEASQDEYDAHDDGTEIADLISDMISQSSFPGWTFRVLDAFALPMGERGPPDMEKLT